MVRGRLVGSLLVGLALVIGLAALIGLPIGGSPAVGPSPFVALEPTPPQTPLPAVASPGVVAGSPQESFAGTPLAPPTPLPSVVLASPETGIAPSIGPGLRPYPGSPPPSPGGPSPGASSPGTSSPGASSPGASSPGASSPRVPSPVGDPSEPPAENPAGRLRRAEPGNGRASRVVVPSLNIDLPIVPGNLAVRRNPNFYPLCDVAQYLTYFVQPGQVGTTYIYAHAQRGMFLPMLRASRRNNGAELIGARVHVYTNDLRLHVYEIYRVKRHALNLDIAYNVKRGEQRLILQTSEGPPGHRPVLQVAARPVGVYEATAAEALPRARPRVCYPGRR